MPRLFTLDEANALLPRLTGILTEMQATKPELDALRGELGEMTETAAGNGHLLEDDLKAKRKRAQELVARLNTLLEELNATGCELKGVEEGLIDFRSRRQGRTIYLCWKLGEERIAWWHDLDAGFAGRRPLETL